MTRTGVELLFIATPCHLLIARLLFWLLKGRNVVLESKYGSPRIVNDGVTVAKEVELEDPVENIGAKLVRQVGHFLHVCI